MGEHQPDAVEAQQEEADREADARDLLPEDAQADLGPEGAPGAGGGGRDLDEGPQGQRPGEQGDGGGQAGGVLGRGREDGGDRAGVERDQQRDQNRPGTTETISASLTAPWASLLAVLGRHDPLQRAGHRKVDDVGDQVHRAPQHDVEP